MEHTHPPVNVWTEMRVSDKGVSITLLSEWQHWPHTKVEDEAWYTQSELSDSGAIHNDLSLSDETRDLIAQSESGDSATVSIEGLGLEVEGIDSEEETVSYQVPEVGEVVTDTAEQPSWSESGKVEIVAHTDERADEYTVKSDGLKRTVAEMNLSEPGDAPVVIGRYLGSTKEYAFPVTRLK